MRSIRPALAAALIAFMIGCNEQSPSPTDPGPLATSLSAASAVLSFSQISAGKWHTCGVTTDKRAYCWGDNLNGQLGDGTTTDRARPTPVATSLQFILVSAGGSYSCGITTENRAYCWGQNTSGQLGDGTITNRQRPVAVDGPRRYRQVRAGHFHTCAVNSFDAVFCWGQNSDGQLGDGTKTNRRTPVKVLGGHSFRRVFTAGRHSCGATTSNRAYCWGKNEDGQLGDGTVTLKLKPVLVAGSHSFSQVFVGAAQGGAWSSVSCGLTTTEQAYCWGDNATGQVGDGTSGFGLIRKTPVAVKGGLQFSGLSTGGAHTCGVTTTSRAYCWGSDGNFQLGDGNFSQALYTTPNAVTGGLLFRAITAGTFHTCAITITDRAYCWGNNFQGQLGIGVIDSGSGFTPRSAPIAVVGP
jgi:alpha-tubulin suppressor-like RCC1 family protein